MTRQRTAALWRIFDVEDWYNVSIFQCNSETCTGYWRTKGTACSDDSYFQNLSETVETTAVVDLGAAGTFISEDFIKLHKIRTHRLSKPFKVTTTNGSLTKGSPITHYCILTVKIDDCAMIGKFNVTCLGKRDQILLGIPWL